MRDKKTFTIAFPNISDLDVTITESGKGIESNENPHKYLPATITKTIKCSNPDCRKGGLNIATVIWEMVATESTTAEGTITCNGMEGNPLSKRKRHTCLNSFHYKINLKYKQKLAHAG